MKSIFFLIFFRIKDNHSIPQLHCPILQIYHFYLITYHYPNYQQNPTKKNINLRLLVITNKILRYQHTSQEDMKLFILSPCMHAYYCMPPTVSVGPSSITCWFWTSFTTFSPRSTSRTFKYIWRTYQIPYLSARSLRFYYKTAQLLPFVNSSQLHVTPIKWQAHYNSCR